MSEVYVHQQQKVGRFTVKVVTDDCPESPRDWDNLGVMVCLHKRYNLGDKHSIKSGDFNGWDEIKEHLRKEHQAKLKAQIKHKTPLERRGALCKK